MISYISLLIEYLLYLLDMNYACTCVTQIKGFEGASVFGELGEGSRGETVAKRDVLGKV